MKNNSNEHRDYESVDDRSQFLGYIPKFDEKENSDSERLMHFDSF